MADMKDGLGDYVLMTFAAAFIAIILTTAFLSGALF